MSGILDGRTDPLEDACEDAQTVERLLHLARAIRFLNEKWNVYLLLILDAEGPQRFNALRDLCKGPFGGDISTRTLAVRLAKMQKRHLVERRSYAESPPRVEYRLTPEGREFTRSLVQAILILNRHMAEEYWNDIDPAMRHTIDRGKLSLEQRIHDPAQRGHLLRLYRSLPPVETRPRGEDGQSKDHA